MGFAANSIRSGERRSTPTKRKSTVLVVGDFILDYSLRLGPPAAHPTSQAHGGIVPQKFAVDPAFRQKSVRIVGGIGTVARALTTFNVASVIAAGAWSDDVDPSALSPKKCPRTRWIRLYKTPITTTRWRLYEPRGDQLSLSSRFDLDLAAESKHYSHPQSPHWPAPADIDMVVVVDFNKGLLDQPAVRSALQKYAGIPFVLKCKRKAEDSVIWELPWTLLTVNAQDLRYALDRDPFHAPLFRRSDSTCSVHPGVLDALSEWLRLGNRFKVKQTHDPSAAFLLRLEKEGALLINRGHLHAMPVPESRQGKWLGLSAGDVMVSAFAADHLRAGVAWAKADLPFQCAHAVDMATRYASTTDNVNRDPSHFGANVRIDSPPRGPEDIHVFDLGPIHEARRTGRPHGAYEWLIGFVRRKGAAQGSQRVRLQDARWYLNDFLTTDASLGRRIAEVREQIDSYSSGTGDRPLAIAICGTPGGGKSTLAKALSNAHEGLYIADNVAQWSSVEDLYRLFEQVRTARLRERHRIPIVFLDEVDAKVQHEELYGKLLSPLWDGAYVLHGEVRTIGRAVFLLAGSTGPWASESELAKAAHGLVAGQDGKLRDLLSRLAIPPVEVTDITTRRTDRLYTVVFMILKRFPAVSRIQRGLIRALCESKIHHGARSLQFCVDALAVPSPMNLVKCADLPPGALNDLRLHVTDCPSNWRKDTHGIEVSY